MIVQATTEQHKKDVFALTDLWHSKSVYKDRTLNQDKLEKIWADPGFLILLAYKDEEPIGFLVGFKSECLFTDTITTSELAWYSTDPRTTVHLFKSYEYWATNIAEADVISTGCTVNETPEKFYKRHGYHLVSKSFEKEL